MCYTVSIKLSDDGVKFFMSNCFGFGFNWKDPAFVEAVKNRDERLWEVLEWAASGGAENFNKAATFDEYLTSYNDGGRDLLYAMKQYDKAKLSAFLENEDLSEAGRAAITSFLDGSLAEKVRNEKPKPVKKKTNPGFVYLILAENGLYKIGKAKNITSRLQPFSVHFPMKWELVHSFGSEDYSMAEAELHELFADKRDVGEWFKLLPRDVAHITAIQDGGL